MNHTLLRLAPVLALCPSLLLPLPAGAQQPSDAKAPRPLRYESAFADYKPFRDLEPGDWRALNDRVGTAALKGGGHAGHGMAPTAPAEPPAPAASTPKPMPHAPHQHQPHKEGLKK